MKTAIYKLFLPIQSKSAILFILVFSSMLVNAQPLNPATPVPLDGGLIALLAAGAVYGAKKKNDIA